MLAINTIDWMRSLAIDGSFDLDQSPPQMAVRKLLTKATEQQKALGTDEYAFVNMDLRDFLPGWCAEASPVIEGHGTGDSRNNNKGILDPVTWRLEVAIGQTCKGLRTDASVLRDTCQTVPVTSPHTYIQAA